MSGVTVKMQGIQSIALPQELRADPRVSNSWFYVIPERLLDLFERYLGANRLDADLMILERTLSRRANAITACVGFGDGVPVIDHSLSSAPTLTEPNAATTAYLNLCQAAGHRVDDFLKPAQQRFESLSLPRRSYLGWLWTNPRFRSELEKLSSEHHSLFQKGNTPPLALANASALPKIREVQDVSNGDASVALQQLAARWRLTQIRGPLTVEPLSVHVPSPLPHLDAVHSQNSGTIIYVPDIAPLPDRDELRQLLEENVRQTAGNAEHLREWIELIRSDTQGKRPIIKFARWYALRHYHQLLTSRHQQSLSNCKQKIMLAFSEFFDVSQDTIDRDLREIADRLQAP